MSDITIVNLFFNEPEPDGRVGYVPIGPLYVVAALESAGYEVEFRDYLTAAADYPYPMEPETIYRFMNHCAPIIGISCASELIPLAVQAVALLKEEEPEKIVIFGGIGSAGIALELMTLFPFIDFIVKGEGEHSAVALLHRLKAGRSAEGLPGLMYRRNDTVITGPEAGRIADLDQLPFPAYHHVDIHRYLTTAIYSARGCPYTCTFCDTGPFWKRQHVTRSVENIVDEMELLVQTFGKKDIDINDDILVLDRQKILELCCRLRDRRLDIRWGCSSRIDLIDEELMEQMALGGCNSIFYGVESGAERVLQQINKGFTCREAEQVLMQSQKYFHTVISLMWGFPFETLEDFKKTLALKHFLSDNDMEVDIYLLSALPLSVMYPEYKDQLIFCPEKFHLTFDGLCRDPEPALEFILNYPSVSQWFYRYPTASFREKLDSVGLLGELDDREPRAD